METENEIFTILTVTAPFCYKLKTKLKKKKKDKMSNLFYVGKFCDDSQPISLLEVRRIFINIPGFTFNSITCK